MSPELTPVIINAPAIALLSPKILSIDHQKWE
jgi:hypothetical protein